METSKLRNLPKSQIKRNDKIKALFQSEYGNPVAFFARSPGRVNLIGEHIDYCGYAVLPMAIEQDIVIAASHNTSGVINLKNTNTKYESYTVKVNEAEIDR